MLYTIYYLLSTIYYADSWFPMTLPLPPLPSPPLPPLPSPPCLASLPSSCSACLFPSLLPTLFLHRSLPIWLSTNPNLVIHVLVLLSTSLSLALLVPHPYCSSHSSPPCLLDILNSPSPSLALLAS